MAQIWNKRDASGWQEVALTGAVQLVETEIRPVEDLAAAARSGHPLVFCHRIEQAEPVWLIVTRGFDGVEVNGEPLVCGLRVLNDRDSIRLPGQLDAVYFSTERLARVEAFPEQTGVYCPRCRLEIHPGDEAVQCPGCAVWHHQTAERGCYGYAETCAVCDHSSDLENPRYRWTPEDL